MAKSDNNSESGNFLGRWSRRKVRAKSDPLPDTLEDEIADEPALQPAPGQHIPGRMITDAPIDPDSKNHADSDTNSSDVAALEHPAGDNASITEHTPDDTDGPAEVDIAKIDIDALDAESDYTRFMGDNVPEHIRAKALKKLWSSNPAFGHMDLLDDYAEDFTDAAWVVDNLRTSYRVGRGFMTDEEVAEWEALGADSKPKPDDDKTSATGEIGDIAIGLETADQPEVIAMLKASEELHNGLYPVESSHFMSVPDLLAPNVRFVVARVEGKTAGCCALVLGNETYAEIRRLWVTPELRHNGVARRLLATLEDRARSLNIPAIRLRTGIKQDAALKFYRAAGYHECELFGTYQADPQRLFLEKTLS